MIESCLKFSREFWKEKESQIGLLPGLFPSQPRDTLLFVLMTLNPPPSQFTVVFLKVLLSPLSYFFSICLNPNPSNYNLVQGPLLLIIRPFCHKSWNSVAIHLQTPQLPRVKTHHF